ncbi:MAG: response regulator [Monoglobaceae bacterium]
MIKILITDDEEFSRKQIKGELLRMEIPEDCIIEAINGADALQKAKEQQIHILITDIRMPRMLGTELAQRVLQLYPGCKVLFLSGYSDKEYLKAAIKLSVIDYIEKPLDPDEFTKAMQKAIDEISETDKAYQNDNESSLKLLEALFRNHSIDTDALPEQLRKILKNSFFTAAIIAPCTEYEADIIQHVRERAARCNISVLSRFKNNGNIELLFAGSDKDTGVNVKKIFDDLFSIPTDGKYKCAIGNFVDKSKKIYISYENAVCALDNAFFYPPNTPVCFTESIRQSTPDTKETAQQLYASLSEEDFDKAHMIMDSLYRSLYKNNSVLSAAAKKIYYAIFENIHTFFKNYFMPYNDEFSLYTSTFNIHEAQFLDDLNHHITSTLNRIEQLLKNTGHNGPVKTALYYIEKNYSNSNLSIVDIAQYCNVNSNYLCGMFKSSTGKTINNYVNNLRIEASKKMLLETNLHIAQIAGNCGFNDAKYFCKVFGKYVNLTPTEFRKKYK